jgi:hypothetical protein
MKAPAENAAPIFVAQIFNLPYRRFAIGRALAPAKRPDHFTTRRMQFCDTAEFNSALLE